MLSMNFLFDFSRNHCGVICAFLVPANLLFTLGTVSLAIQLRPLSQVYLSAIAATFFALTLLLHDFTWFSIGVVMPPTYILFTLACVCLSLNIWAIAHPASMKQLIKEFMLIGYKNIASLTHRTF
ncbi:MAG TPA: hypothetical protein IGS53_05350 [Leptolyngbyaceae cyanobacterium M33_DOE_097]|uniref:Uncharacterized protein n=1 Tax=Oscillatoriales cyanobacterium SpSt-418 TaxID=2282169 RepID=A0A7C3PMI3_9CYAN|nr:hypothetical protein [Leptolyngbyaceae cyanobacterium M33_DOE_097]